MPFVVKTTGEEVLLELSGAVTVRHARDLANSLASLLAAGSRLTLRAQAIDDIDTSILQLLVSLRKTAAAFCVTECSDAFVNAVDRCALRRELLPKEFA